MSELRLEERHRLGLDLHAVVGVFWHGLGRKLQHQQHQFGAYSYDLPYLIVCFQRFRNDLCRLSASRRPTLRWSANTAAGLMSLPKLDLSLTADKCQLLRAHAHVGSTKGLYTYAFPLSCRITRRMLLDCNLVLLLARLIEYNPASTSSLLAKPWEKPARRPKMSLTCVSRSLEQV